MSNHRTERDAGRETAVEAALGKLDLTAKVALLGGADMWSLPANDDIGLGRLVMSDGPAGVRGERWTPDDPSIAIPSPTALAATWDPELAHRIGGLLAQEARRKGVHVVLAPTVNLHRSPRGGRHFEGCSEDPLLTGEIGAALVAGVQDGGVGTTPKHWVANDSETERYTVDVRADERTLREVYLAPFEAIVRKACPWGLMAAYNQVNGHSMSEHDELNNGVLREEWGFDGILVSDWTGARDTVRAALGGLDVAMPGPVTVYGEHLVAAVRDGRVPEESVDELARRVLRLAARVGLLADAPAVVTAPPAPIDGEALAREVAARSFTLVSNDGILPLGPGLGSVALIGAAAAEARIGGGGSAQVFPTRVTSPLDGLRAALPGTTALGYALGADPRTHVAPLRAGVTAELLGAAGEVLTTAQLPDGSLRWIGELPDGIGFDVLRAVRATATLVPQAAGVHRVAIRGAGRFVLEAAGRVLFDGVVEIEGNDPAAAFLNPPEAVFELDLQGSAPVGLTLTHTLPEVSGFAGFGLVSFALGHSEPVATADELIDEAVALAAAADVAVVVVATTEEVESEGVDRIGLALPGRQDELVARVAAAPARPGRRRARRWAMCCSVRASPEVGCPPPGPRRRPTAPCGRSSPPTAFWSTVRACSSATRPGSGAGPRSPRTGSGTGSATPTGSTRAWRSGWPRPWRTAVPTRRAPRPWCGCATPVGAPGARRSRCTWPPTAPTAPVPTVDWPASPW